LGDAHAIQPPDPFYPLVSVPLVLVVDDEADIRDLVRLNLELEGHDVEVAADGAAALAAIAEGLRPDLVLLDLMMPKVDGWEVLRQLKADADPDVTSTPIVLLTAKTGELDRIRGGIEGALRYLTKPFNVAVLLEAVTDAIEADEAEARLAAQTSALQHLARLEKGETGEPDATGKPDPAGRRVRFSRLERQPDGPLPAPAHNRSAAASLALDLSRLSAKQLEVLEAVGRHPTVRVASAALGVSRSNVYASLRRIAAKLHVASVHELVAFARERAG
jgi:DNA-binding response OmpR family regulator/DNA-binding CsgD family transcriptional regulator